MAQLEFDEETARQLDAAYRSPDIVRRRKLARAALRPQPGERVVDVGCGPGYYVEELLTEVGPEGTVVGVDSSPEMLGVAARRVEGHDNVRFHQADAADLPLDGEGFDGLICVQVLEYVTDVPAVLEEFRRVLRPGGRLVIWDTDFATISMQTAKPERMERVLRAFDEHLTHPSLPRVLGRQLRRAGFDDVLMQGHVFATSELTPQTYAGALLPIFVQFVAGREEVGAEEAEAWFDEQTQLNERGEFFFSITQFCFSAKRPS